MLALLVCIKDARLTTGRAVVFFSGQDNIDILRYLVTLGQRTFCVYQTCELSLALGCYLSVRLADSFSFTSCLIEGPLKACAVFISLVNWHGGSGGIRTHASLRKKKSCTATGISINVV